MSLSIHGLDKKTYGGEPCELIAEFSICMDKWMDGQVIFTFNPDISVLDAGWMDACMDGRVTFTYTPI